MPFAPAVVLSCWGSKRVLSAWIPVNLLLCNLLADYLHLHNTNVAFLTQHAQVPALQHRYKNCVPCTSYQLQISARPFDYNKLQHQQAQLIAPHAANALTTNVATADAAATLELSSIL